MPDQRALLGEVVKREWFERRYVYNDPPGPWLERYSVRKKLCAIDEKGEMQVVVAVVLRSSGVSIATFVKFHQESRPHMDNCIATSHNTEIYLLYKYTSLTL